MILDKKTIALFRKEFLRMVEDPHKLDDIFEWEKIKRRWVENFKEIWWEKASLILDKKQGNIEWEKRIRDNTAGFLFKFNSNPKNYGQTSPVRYKQEIEKWERSVRRLAPSIWKYLNWVVNWYEKTLDIGENYPAKFEGFTVIIKGYQTAFEPEDSLEKFKEVLKIYRDRAKKVLPLLLNNPLPFVLDFNAKPLAEEAGVYKADKIWVNPHNFEKNLGNWVTVLAHEVGHHIWKTYLSKKDQEFWERMITGNLGMLDLNEVLRRYGDEKEFFDNDRIRKEDPLLYLQIQGLSWTPGIDDYFSPIYTMKDLREYVEKSGLPKVRVHGKPITGYAHKNSEEAFCEAIGMLVGYGPMAILPDVQDWLKEILPQVKIAHIS